MVKHVPSCQRRLRWKTSGLCSRSAIHKNEYDRAPRSGTRWRGQNWSKQMTYTTFREAYGALKNHAETLRSQQEPNIDDLLHIVEDSVAAFKVCQQRIDAVEKALEAAL